MLVVAALLTGAAVAVSGIVGFVGLIVPHAVRLVVGPSHRRRGAGVGARRREHSSCWPISWRGPRIRPQEISLGVITACCGAPFFLFLLLRYRREVGYL